MSRDGCVASRCAQEFATDSYAKSGHPFGFPAPSFVMHANADRWPFGLGGQHLIVPYMPAIDLMSARARTIADVRAPVWWH